MGLDNYIAHNMLNFWGQYCHNAHVSPFVVQSFTYIIYLIHCGLNYQVFFHVNLWVPRVSHILPIWRLETIIFLLY